MLFLIFLFFYNVEASVYKMPLTEGGTFTTLYGPKLRPPETDGSPYPNPLNWINKVGHLFFNHIEDRDNPAIVDMEYVDKKLYVVAYDPKSAGTIIFFNVYQNLITDIRLHVKNTGREDIAKGFDLLEKLMKCLREICLGQEFKSELICKAIPKKSVSSAGYVNLSSESALGRTFLYTEANGVEMFTVAEKMNSATERKEKFSPRLEKIEEETLSKLPINRRKIIDCAPKVKTPRGKSPAKLRRATQEARANYEDRFART